MSVITDDWCVRMRPDGTEFAEPAQTLPHADTIYEGTRDECEFFIKRGIEMGAPKLRNEKRAPGDGKWSLEGPFDENGELLPPPKYSATWEGDA